MDSAACFQAVESYLFNACKIFRTCPYKVEKWDFGKFGWVIDPEGNTIKLWEPPVA